MATNHTLTPASLHLYVTTDTRIVTEGTKTCVWTREDSLTPRHAHKPHALDISLRRRQDGDYTDGRAYDHNRGSHVLCGEPLAISKQAVCLSSCLPPAITEFPYSMSGPDLASGRLALLSRYSESRQEERYSNKELR